jgi:hypothetical protein
VLAPYSCLEISNDHGQEVRFTFRINGLFPVTIPCPAIDPEGDSAFCDIGRALDLLTFVATGTFHSASDSSFKKNWDAERFVNSVGGGLCDERAGLLAAMLESKGYRSRLVDLKGHVVLEFWTGKKWVLLDADRHMFYVNHEGELASHNELIADKELISRPVSTTLHLRSNAYSKSGYMSAKMANDYTISAPSYYEFTQSGNCADSVFVLPARTALTVTIIERAHIVEVKLNLEEASKGSAHLPWIPLYAVGPCELRVDNDRLDLARADTFWFGKVDSLSVSHAEKGSVIGYRANHLLKVFNHGNFISTSSSNTLKISCFEVGQSDFEYAEELRYALLMSKMDSILAQEDAVLYELEGCATGQPVRALRSKLEVYLDHIDTLTSKDKERMRSELDPFLSELASSRGSTVEEVSAMLCDLAPFGPYLMFTSLRFEEVDLLNRKFTEISGGR